MPNFSARVTLSILIAGATTAYGAATVAENSREIPVAHNVDVVVIGRSSRHTVDGALPSCSAMERTSCPALRRA